MVTGNKSKVPVTVAIPVYNGENFIVEAIQSVIDQSCDIEEILICDNKSTDETIKVSEKFFSEINLNNFRIIKNEINYGYVKNMNICLENCRTEYLRFLHTDDIIKHSSIEEQIRYFESNPEIALVAGREEYEDENSQIKHPKVILTEPRKFKSGEIFEFATEMGHYLPVSTVMLDMKKVRNVGFLPENTLAGDELFWLKILETYPIIIINKTHITRRIHGSNLELDWFLNKRFEFVNGCNRIVDFLKTAERRTALKEILIKHELKRFSRVYLGIAASVVKRFNNSKISIWYLVKSLEIKISNFFTRLFWKVIFLNIINLFGLYYKINLHYKKKE